MTPEEIVSKSERYRTYFGTEGGITLSGGEPLLQAEFAAEIFRLCKERGIHTCLDTSGSILNESVKKLLSVTDRILLDLKYPTDEQYREYVGCGIDAPLQFLEYADSKKIPVTLRQVIIPTLNDTEHSIAFLNRIKERYSSVDGIELLPFRKICAVKYQKLGIPFRFESFDTPTAEEMNALQSLLETK